VKVKTLISRRLRLQGEMGQRSPQGEGRRTNKKRSLTASLFVAKTRGLEPPGDENLNDFCDWLDT